MTHLGPHACYLPLLALLACLRGPSFFCNSIALREIGPMILVLGRVLPAAIIVTCAALILNRKQLNLPRITWARLATRFAGETAPVDAARATLGKQLQADQAAELGLVTFTPDELDWEEELRIAIEERTALSPDALTGMEASLRFAGSETMDTRIFGRLTAWQNWIFNRPNAVGEAGALKVYGTGAKAKFNWERV